MMSATLAGDLGHEFGLVGGHAEAAAELGDAAQALDAGLAGAGLGADAGGKAAAGCGDDGEDGQRDHVVDAADGELVEGRQEKEVPGEEAEGRGEEGDP